VLFCVATDRILGCALYAVVFALYRMRNHAHVAAWPRILDMNNPTISTTWLCSLCVLA
jgi:hypothetical protein